MVHRLWTIRSTSIGLDLPCWYTHRLQIFAFEVISSEETAETSKNYPKTSKSLGRTDPKTRSKETGRSRSPLNRTIFMAIKMVMGFDCIEIIKSNDIKI